MNREPVIQTINLPRLVGGLLAVDRIAVSVNPGEVFGLLGPKGAGKTTAVRLFAACLESTSGDFFQGYAPENW